MKLFIPILLFIMVSNISIAQVSPNKMVGEWKSYLEDQINFEFLRLNEDGTGIKCFGQTIDGHDTLFTEHVTALKIISWKLKNKSLNLESQNKVLYPLDPNYEIKFIDDGKIELTGENLLLHIYPSILARKGFMRGVSYSRREALPKLPGAKSAPCISALELIYFNGIDSNYQLAQHEGLGNIIPYLTGCKHGYIYDSYYFDSTYSLKVPLSISQLSTGYGNRSFYISLNTKDGDSSESSIVIYYDFQDKDQKSFLDKLSKGEEVKEIVTLQGKEIYKSKNWQGKFEGKCFVGANMYIAYYTRNEKMQEVLQQSIASFNFHGK